MAAIDLVDDTFIAARPDRIAATVRDAERWARWWPDLELSVFMDRGIKGIRWSVTGQFRGSNEIWIEPSLDGAIVHYYLRVDPASGIASTRAADRIRAARAKSWKQAVWALKDELEGGRSPGDPADGS